MRGPRDKILGFPGRRHPKWGDGIEERLARIEERTKNLATKQDILNLKQDISNLRNWLLKWIIGLSVVLPGAMFGISKWSLEPLIKELTGKL